MGDHDNTHNVSLPFCLFVFRRFETVEVNCQSEAVPFLTRQIRGSGGGRGGGRERGGRKWAGGCVGGGVVDGENAHPHMLKRSVSATAKRARSRRAERPPGIPGLVRASSGGGGKYF
jgi:hypothetical protein